MKALSLALYLFDTFTNLLHPHQKNSYCLPSDPCFPSSQNITRFNETIGGRLIKATPYGAVCYGSTFDVDACKELVSKKSDPTHRHSMPAGVMYTNWEQDGTDHGCPIPDEVPLSALAGECTLGGMAAYIVNATSADDVAEAVKFANEWNLRLRVKNTGHDYMGRSTGPGALSIWTRHLKDAVLIKDFKPCADSAPQDVLSAGSGVEGAELYQWGEDNGKVTIGGFAKSVGATGGYVLGGGTGPLGPIFGMGVDNVVQFEVVTADGEKRIANECENADLFWALRGGGGAFAVTTRVYLKTYPALKAVNTISGALLTNNKESYTALIKALVDLQIPMREYGFTGIWETAYPNVAFLATLPYTNSSVLPAEETFKIVSPLLSIPGVKSTLKAVQSKSWNEAYKKVIWPTVEGGSKVGVNIADVSRLISYDLIESQEGRDKIVEYILSLRPSEPFIWQNAVGEATRKIGLHETAVHPAWRTAFAFMDVPVFGPWYGVTSHQNATALSVIQKATEVFGTATYYNEACTQENNWQDAMFGENYQKLLSVKRNWDPKSVFGCRQCVGSELGY